MWSARWKSNTIKKIRAVAFWQSRKFAEHACLTLTSILVFILAQAEFSWAMTLLEWQQNVSTFYSSMCKESGGTIKGSIYRGFNSTRLKNGKTLYLFDSEVVDCVATSSSDFPTGTPMPIAGAGQVYYSAAVGSKKDLRVVFDEDASGYSIINTSKRRSLTIQFRGNSGRLDINLD